MNNPKQNNPKNQYKVTFAILVRDKTNQENVRIIRMPLHIETDDTIDEVITQLAASMHIGWHNGESNDKPL